MKNNKTTKKEFHQTNWKKGKCAVSVLGRKEGKPPTNASSALYQYALNVAEEYVPYVQ